MDKTKKGIILQPVAAVVHWFRRLENPVKTKMSENTFLKQIELNYKSLWQVWFNKACKFTSVIVSIILYQMVVSNDI